MIRGIVITLLLAVVIMLVLALRDLFSGGGQQLTRSLGLRVGLSLMLLFLVMGAYLFGELGVSQYLQYL